MHCLKQHVLSPHHRYQIGVVFIFILSFFLFVIYISIIDYFNLNIAEWGWYAIIPWALLYTKYCLGLRKKIGPGDRVSPLKRPIGHWVALGIILIYMNILETSEIQRLYPAINFSFIIFSIFLADSYWDFKNITNKAKEA